MNTESLLCSKDTLLAFVQLAVHQDTQVLFCQAVFQLRGAKYVLVPGVASPLGQDLTILPAELPEFPVNPFPKPVQAPLDVSMNPQTHQTFLSVLCHLQIC